jgi:hypothetical protein
MEGYLLLWKPSAFALGMGGSKVKVWVVLDGCELSYFKRFDEVLKLPMEVKGVVVIKETTVITSEADIRYNIEHGLKIKTEKGSVLFDCESVKIFRSWFDALEQAKTSEKSAEERRLKPAKLRNILKIDPTCKSCL